MNLMNMDAQTEIGVSYRSFFCHCLGSKKMAMTKVTARFLYAKKVVRCGQAMNASHCMMYASAWDSNKVARPTITLSVLKAHANFWKHISTKLASVNVV